MLTVGLIELVQLSFRFGPELPGNQATRQIVHYRESSRDQKGGSMLSSSGERKLFIIKTTLISQTPTMCQVSYQEHIHYDL